MKRRARGIKDSPPYLHDGRLLTLEDAVEFFDIVLQTQLTADEVDGAVNVSSWFGYGYHDKVQMALGVPCQWAVMPYPLDFRVPETINAERARPQK